MKKIIIVLGVIGAMSVLYGVYMYKKPVENLVEIKSDFKLSATELLQAFETDELVANKKYIGKTLEVTGKIDSVTKENLITAVNFVTENPISSVSCNMDASVLKVNNLLTPGKKITIKAECTGYLMGVVLERGIIINEN